MNIWTVVGYTKPWQYIVTGSAQKSGFNSYAIEDRVDFSSYSDVTRSVDTDIIFMEALLPAQDDLQDLHAHFYNPHCMGSDIS